MLNVVQCVVAEALRYVQAASLESCKQRLWGKKKNYIKFIGRIHNFLFSFSRPARIIVLILRPFSLFYCLGNVSSPLCV